MGGSRIAGLGPSFFVQPCQAEAKAKAAFTVHALRLGPQFCIVRGHSQLVTNRPPVLASGGDVCDVHHARVITCPLAEVAVTGPMVSAILAAIRRL